jgi:hypothetical protein
MAWESFWITAPALLQPGAAAGWLTLVALAEPAWVPGRVVVRMMR